jgi:hypothetical protein
LTMFVKSVNVLAFFGSLYFSFFFLFFPLFCCGLNSGPTP